MDRPTAALMTQLANQALADPTPQRTRQFDALASVCPSIELMAIGRDLPRAMRYAGWTAAETARRVTRLLDEMAVNVRVTTDQGDIETIRNAYRLRKLAEDGNPRAFLLRARGSESLATCGRLVAHAQALAMRAAEFADDQHRAALASGLSGTCFHMTRHPTQSSASTSGATAATTVPLATLTGIPVPGLGTTSTGDPVNRALVKPNPVTRPDSWPQQTVPPLATYKDVGTPPVWGTLRQNTAAITYNTRLLRPMKLNSSRLRELMERCHMRMARRLATAKSTQGGTVKTVWAAMYSKLHGEMFGQLSKRLAAIYGTNVDALDKYTGSEHAMFVETATFPNIYSLTTQDVPTIAVTSMMGRRYDNVADPEYFRAAAWAGSERALYKYTLLRWNLAVKRGDIGHDTPGSLLPQQLREMTLAEIDVDTAFKRCHGETITLSLDDPASRAFYDACFHLADPLVFDKLLMEPGKSPYQLAEPTDIFHLGGLNVVYRSVRSAGSGVAQPTPYGLASASSSRAGGMASPFRRLPLEFLVSVAFAGGVLVNHTNLWAMQQTALLVTQALSPISFGISVALGQLATQTADAAITAVAMVALSYIIVTGVSSLIATQWNTVVSGITRTVTTPVEGMTKEVSSAVGATVAWLNPAKATPEAPPAPNLDVGAIASVAEDLRDYVEGQRISFIDTQLATLAADVRTRIEEGVAKLKTAGLLDANLQMVDREGYPAKLGQALADLVGDKKKTLTNDQLRTVLGVLGATETDETLLQKIYNAAASEKTPATLDVDTCIKQTQKLSARATTELAGRACTLIAGDPAPPPPPPSLVETPPQPPPTSPLTPPPEEPWLPHWSTWPQSVATSFTAQWNGLLALDLASLEQHAKDMIARNNARIAGGGGMSPPTTLSADSIWTACKNVMVTDTCGAAMYRTGMLGYAFGAKALSILHWMSPHSPTISGWLSWWCRMKGYLLERTLLFDMALYFLPMLVEPLGWGSAIGTLAMTVFASMGAIVLIDNLENRRRQLETTTMYLFHLQTDEAGRDKAAEYERFTRFLGGSLRTLHMPFAGWHLLKFWSDIPADQRAHMPYSLNHVRILLSLGYIKDILTMAAAAFVDGFSLFTSVVAAGLLLSSLPGLIWTAMANNPAASVILASLALLSLIRNPPRWLNAAWGVLMYVKTLAIAFAGNSSTRLVAAFGQAMAENTGMDEIRLILAKNVNERGTDGDLDVLRRIYQFNDDQAISQTMRPAELAVAGRLTQFFGEYTSQRVHYPETERRTPEQLRDQVRKHLAKIHGDTFQAVALAANVLPATSPSNDTEAAAAVTRRYPFHVPYDDQQLATAMIPLLSPRSSVPQTGPGGRHVPWREMMEAVLPDMSDAWLLEHGWGGRGYILHGDDTAHYRLRRESLFGRKQFLDAPSDFAVL